MGSPKETGFFNGLFIFFFLFLFNVGGKKKMKPIKIQVSFVVTGIPARRWNNIIRASKRKSFTCGKEFLWIGLNVVSFSSHGISVSHKYKIS